MVGRQTRSFLEGLPGKCYIRCFWGGSVIYSCFLFEIYFEDVSPQL